MFLAACVMTCLGMIPYVIGSEATDRALAFRTCKRPDEAARATALAGMCFQVFAACMALTVLFLVAAVIAKVIGSGG